MIYDGVRLDEMELHITDLMKYGGYNITNKIGGNGDSDLGDSFNFGSSGLPEGWYGFSEYDIDLVSKANMASPNMTVALSRNIMSLNGAWTMEHLWYNVRPTYVCGGV